MKILFFGTPLFAEIVLDRLLKSEHQVVGVVARADKPAGRGNKMVSPKTVEMARANGLLVFQPEKLLPEIENFKNVDCDIFVTASYGKILPKALLDIRPCINVHPSLLPKYRGATPIQAALLCGDKVTGVTIMKTEVGMDDGDILAQQKFDILPEDDCNSLMQKLANLGADLLIEVLDNIQKVGFQNLPSKPQDHSQATFVKTIQKQDALLDFSEDAQMLQNKVRAFVSSPVAYFFVGGERIKVFKARAILPGEIEKGAFLREICQKTNFEPGKILCTKKRFLIAAKDGILEILQCQAPGGKVLESASFLNGFHFKSDKVDSVLPVQGEAL